MCKILCRYFRCWLAKHCITTSQLDAEFFLWKILYVFLSLTYKLLSSNVKFQLWEHLLHVVFVSFNYFPPSNFLISCFGPIHVCSWVSHFLICRTSKIYSVISFHKWRFQSTTLDQQKLTYLVTIIYSQNMILVVSWPCSPENPTFLLFVGVFSFGSFDPTTNP